MKAKSYVHVGVPRFRIESARSARLNFIAETTCMWCSRPLRVHFGVLLVVARIGQEFVGVLCDGCVTPAARTRLEAERRGTEKENA